MSTGTGTEKRETKQNGSGGSREGAAFAVHAHCRKRLYFFLFRQNSLKKLVIPLDSFMGGRVII